MIRLKGGLGNQVLSLLSGLVLSCLTSRAFYIEGKPDGDALLTTAFAMRWEGRRQYTTPSLRDSSAARLSPVNLLGIGDMRAHSRLACDADLSGEARLLVTSDVYFLKGLMVNWWHQPAIQSGESPCVWWWRGRGAFSTPLHGPSAPGRSS